MPTQSKVRLVTIVFHKKVIRIAMLSMAIAVFLSGNAKAGDYSQLTRNGTLEAASMDKSLHTVQQLQNGQKNKDEIKKKAKELEGVFLSVMIEPMFPEGKESNLYGGGAGNGVFRTLIIQEYGKNFADAGGVGIAKGVEKQLNRQIGG